MKTEQPGLNQINTRLRSIYKASGGNPFARNTKSAKRQIMTYGMGSGYQKPTLMDYPRMKTIC